MKKGILHSKAKTLEGTKTNAQDEGEYKHSSASRHFALPALYHAEVELIREPSEWYPVRMLMPGDTSELLER